MRHRKWFLVPTCVGDWKPKPILFDAATRLNSKSRSSGERKKVRAERTIISYNLPELWLRQIQRSSDADIQRARETCLSVSVPTSESPSDSRRRDRVCGDIYGMATVMLLRCTVRRRLPSIALMRSLTVIPNSLVAISEPYSICLSYQK
jgi:hypothetical protein